MRNLTWEGHVLLLTIVIEDLSLQPSILFNCPYQEAMWTSGVDMDKDLTWCMYGWRSGTDPRRIQEVSSVGLAWLDVGRKEREDSRPSKSSPFISVWPMTWEWILHFWIAGKKSKGTYHFGTYENYVKIFSAPNWILIGTQPHPLATCCLMTAFILQPQGWLVATEAI